jgi:hypothetical protein
MGMWKARVFTVPGSKRFRWAGRKRALYLRNLAMSRGSTPSVHSRINSHCSWSARSRYRDPRCRIPSSTMGLAHLGRTGSALSSPSGIVRRPSSVESRSKGAPAAQACGDEAVGYSTGNPVSPRIAGKDFRKAILERGCRLYHRRRYAIRFLAKAVARKAGCD